MKIYCSRTEYTLSDFVDKELWVRCLIQSTGNPDVWYDEYIRIKYLIYMQEPVKGWCMAYNCISADFVDKSYSSDFDGAVAISYLMNNTVYTYQIEDSVKVVKPIDTLTTDEMTDILLSRKYPLGE